MIQQGLNFMYAGLLQMFENFNLYHHLNMDNLVNSVQFTIAAAGCKTKVLTKGLRRKAHVEYLLVWLRRRSLERRPKKLVEQSSQSSSKVTPSSKHLCCFLLWSKVFLHDQQCHNSSQMERSWKKCLQLKCLQEDPIQIPPVQHLKQLRDKVAKKWW